MSKNDDEIRLLGADLIGEETLPNTECPACSGGLSKEKSFSVTRMDNGYLYHCYRASCNFKGFTPEKGGKKPHVKLKVQPDKGGNKGKRSRKFRGKTVNLSAGQMGFLTKRFTLTQPELVNARLRWDPNSAAYIVPIYNSQGYKVGDISRNWTGRVPKAINYWDNAKYNLYFPWNLHKITDTIVVVEDFLSAIKVNRYLPCVALLGCNLGENEAAHLRTLAPRLVIALDNDATSKALSLSKEYKLLFQNIAVQHLDKDPKDMHGAELRNAFDRKY